MPRYFFTLRGADTDFQDEEGMVLRDADAARKAAERVVREIKEDGTPPGDYALIVTDEAGTELFVIPFGHLQ